MATPAPKIAPTPPNSDAATVVNAIAVRQLVFPAWMFLMDRTDNFFFMIIEFKIINYLMS